jgi:hypothetical protein
MGFFVSGYIDKLITMITLFDFEYPKIDLSDPIRKEGYPFTYYPLCGALVPDDGIEIYTRSDGSEWYSDEMYHKRYSKRAILGKILGIKPGFYFLNGNFYDWRLENIKWLCQGDAYWYIKRDREILEATMKKIVEDKLPITL